MSEPTDAQKLGVGCGFLLVVMLIAFIASALGGDEPDEPRGPTNDAAIDVCEQSVSKQLKAPATAEFSSQSASNMGSSLDDFVVTGVVDAENSFGANIRTAWRCEAKWLEDTRWSVEAVLDE